MGYINPIPCDHIRAYYQHLWSNNHCIGWKLLWQGYHQCSYGLIDVSMNNLFTIHKFKPA